MKLKLISIEGEILSLEDIGQVVVPTKDGIITILPGHEAIMSAINPGVLEIEDKEGKLHEFAIGGGIIETDGNILRIIADMVDSCSEISEKEVKQKLEASRELLKEIKESGKQINPKELIDLEETILKESARMQLLKR